MGKRWITLGSVLMALAVALGALGAHTLKSQISDTLLDSYKTGVLYHLIHALALVVIGVLANADSKINYALPAWIMFAGILFFSGSIYLLSTREISGLELSFLGPVTPVGGLLFMAAWIILAIKVLKK